MVPMLPSENILCIFSLPESPRDEGTGGGMVPSKNTLCVFFLENKWRACGLFSLAYAPRARRLLPSSLASLPVAPFFATMSQNPPMKSGR